MTYHDFQPYPDGKFRWACYVCKKGRLSYLHFMPDAIDRERSNQTRLQDKQKWALPQGGGWKDQ